VFLQIVVSGTETTGGHVKTLTAVGYALEIHLLNRPLGVTAAMDSLCIDTKRFWMHSPCQKSNTPQCIDVEMHQVVVNACTRMASNNGEMDISVDHGEKNGAISLESRELFVNEGLGDDFEVCLRVFEEESIALSSFDVEVLLAYRSLLLI
jgi:hypothetical protein